MKVTAFIRKTAKKNDTNSIATIYFRLLFPHPYILLLVQRQ